MGNITHKEKPEKETFLKEMLHPLVREWFFSKFESFTLPQQFGIYNIHTRKNTLISAPTGSSKTLTAFLSILNQLVDDALNDRLEDKVYAIYISPLKALNYDISHNLKEPLAEMEAIAKRPLGIRIGVRTGDTTPYQRQKMTKIPPHILITTPESLGLLLVQEKHIANFSLIQWVIIDEIHAIANNKRGVQLTLLLEQLAHLTNDYTRIGLSATAEPLDEIGRYLVGNRDCEIIKIQYTKQTDLNIELPKKTIMSDSFEKNEDALYKKLHEHIQDHKSTLIFTNTRAATERIVHTLKQRNPECYYEINENPPFARSELIAAHHSSLSKDHRSEVEAKLRLGKLKCVVCSSSLELGLDIGFIDLVILLHSPKRVSSLLQRIGRSGHKYSGVAKGRLFAQSYTELVECTSLLLNAKAQQIDRIHIPKNARDVLCQWVIGMCIVKPFSINELFKVATTSHTYATLTKMEFLDCIEYMTENYPELENQYVFAKLNRDEKDIISLQSKTVRLIYLQNSGTITDSGAVTVKQGATILGNVDEGFAENLKPKDVFVLGGESYQFQYMRGMTIQAVPSYGRKPTVPRWYSQSLSLSYDDAQQIARLQTKVKRIIVDESLSKTDKTKKLKSLLSIQKDAFAQFRLFSEMQEDYVGIPTFEELLIEHFEDGAQKYTIIHSHLGRKANEAFALLLTHTISRVLHLEVQFSLSDTGFYLCSKKFIDIEKIIKVLSAEPIEEVFSAAIESSHHLKVRFRACAVRSLLIIPHYKGQTKHVRKQNIKSGMLYNAVKRININHPIIAEAKREVLEDDMDYENAISYLKKLFAKRVKIKTVQTTVCSPFAFHIIAAAYSDMLRPPEKHEYIQNMQQMVIAKIALKAKKGDDFAYETPELVETNFEYKKLWNEQAVVKKQKKEDLSESLHRITLRIDLDSDIKYQLFKLLRGETSGYTRQFKEWFSELQNGAIPDMWSDELITLLRDNFVKLE